MGNVTCAKIHKAGPGSVIGARANRSTGIIQGFEKSGRPPAKGAKRIVHSARRKEKQKNGTKNAMRGKKVSNQ